MTTKELIKEAEAYLNTVFLDKETRGAANLIQRLLDAVKEREVELQKAYNWSQNFYDRCLKNRPKENYLSAGMHSAVNDFDRVILGKHSPTPAGGE